MKETNFIPVFLVLSCVWIASALEINQMKEFSQSSRAEDNTDTWNSLLEIPTGATPKTYLFRDCITPAPLRQVVIWNIKLENKTFVRYEINGLEFGSRAVVWDKKINVTYIVDCVEAAQGYRMLQFDGRTCMMSNESYSYQTKAYCYSLETDNNDVVYINTALPPPNCSANSEQIKIIKGVPICLGVHQSSYDVGIKEASAMCVAKYNGDLYMEMPYLPFADLQAYLKKNNFSGNYLVQATHDCQMGFVWGGSTVAAGKPVNTTYIDQASFAKKYKVDKLYVNATKSYKLVARAPIEKHEVNGKNGFICMTLA